MPLATQEHILRVAAQPPLEPGSSQDTLSIVLASEVHLLEIKLAP